MLSERREMGGRDLVIAVLDEMQELDQEVAADRLTGEQRLDLGERLWIELAALGCRLGALAAGAGMIGSISPRAAVARTSGAVASRT